jgi:hypothetical protein
LAPHHIHHSYSALRGFLPEALFLEFGERQKHRPLLNLLAKVCIASADVAEIGGSMLNPVSNATQPATHPSTTSTSPATPKSAQGQTSQSTSRPIVDKVNISNAAQALQEIRETRVQTAQEAVRGDLQAQRLLAREQTASKP